MHWPCSCAVVYIFVDMCKVLTNRNSSVWRSPMLMQLLHAPSLGKVKFVANYNIEIIMYVFAGGLDLKTLLQPKWLYGSVNLYSTNWRRVWYCILSPVPLLSLTSHPRHIPYQRGNAQHKLFAAILLQNECWSYFPTANPQPQSYSPSLTTIWIRVDIYSWFQGTLTHPARVVLDVWLI